MKKKLNLLVLMIPVFLVSSCLDLLFPPDPPEPPPKKVVNTCIGKGTKSVTVSWTADRSYDVSTAAGGGHKIYYSESSSLDKTTPYVVDVPNTLSQTTGTITGLGASCTIYVRVGSYSAINGPGGSLSTATAVTTTP